MDLGFNIVSTKSQVGTLNLTLVYTRWQEQTKKWGLLYPTFGTTFRIQKVGTKSFYAETRGSETAGTKSLVGTLYLMLRYTK